MYERIVLYKIVISEVMINIKVGNRIKELRKLRGLSQEAFADECGLDRTYITYIENAKKSLTISTLYKITSALNITLKEFFTFEEGDVAVKMNNNNDIVVPKLIVGDSYTNAELSKIFECSTQGGIRVSSRKKTVTIITRENSDTNPYDDTTIKPDGTFVYTGMGLIGDQVVTETNQNGKIAFNDKNDYTIHYFINYKKNDYVYQGVAIKNGPCYYVDELDQKGNLRKVVKFPLKLIKE